MATLGGTGTVVPAVLASGGAILSPGDPLSNTGIGTLTASSLSLAAGTVLKFDFGSGTNDQVNVTTPVAFPSWAEHSFPSSPEPQPFWHQRHLQPLGYTGTLRVFANLSIGSEPQDMRIRLSITRQRPAEIQLSVITATVSATWNVNGGGIWNSTRQKLDPDGIPSYAGEAVTFGPIVTGRSRRPSTLTTPPETVGQVIFNDSSTAYTISNSGSGSLALNNNSSVASIAITAAPTTSGTTISAPVTYAGNLNISDTVAGTSLTLSGGLSGSGAISLQSGTLQIGACSTFSPFSTGNINMSATSSLVFNTSSSLQLAALSAPAEQHRSERHRLSQTRLNRQFVHRPASQ